MTTTNQITATSANNSNAGTIAADLRLILKQTGNKTAQFYANTLNSYELVEFYNNLMIETNALYRSGGVSKDFYSDLHIAGGVKEFIFSELKMDFEEGAQFIIDTAIRAMEKATGRLMFVAGSDYNAIFDNARQRMRCGGALQLPTKKELKQTKTLAN
jgi:hypothetical protein